MKKLFLLSFALICSLISQADSLVTLPTGVTAEDYTLIGEFQVLNNTTKEFEKKSRSISVKVAFNGSDVYLAGLSYNFGKWDKVTKAVVKAKEQRGNL